MKVIIALLFLSSMAEGKLVSVKPGASTACAKVVQSLKACRPATCTFNFVEDDIAKSLTLTIVKAEKRGCAVSISSSIPSLNKISEAPIFLDKVRKNNGVSFLELMRAGKPFTYSFDENSMTCCGKDPGFCRLTSGGTTFLDVFNLTTALDHCSAAPAETAVENPAPSETMNPVPGATPGVLPVPTETVPLVPTPVPTAAAATVGTPLPLPPLPKK